MPGFYRLFMKEISEDKKIFIIIFLGLALRFAFSYFYPLTLDEAWSFTLSKKSFAEIFAEVKLDSTAPAMVHIIHKFFDIGASEFGVRWIFAIAGFLSLFFIKKISKISIIPVAISAFSYFVIKEGSISRMHAFTLFFSSAEIYFFLNTFENKRIQNFIFFCLFSILNSHNFYPSLSLTFGLFVAFLLFFKKSDSPVKYYLYSFALIFIFSITAFYFFSPSSLKSRFITSLKFSSGAFLPYLFYSFAFSQEFFPYNSIRGWKLIIFALTAFFPIFLFLKGLLSKSEYREKILFTTFLFAFLCSFLVSLKIPKVLYSPKYLICVYPIFVAGFARGIYLSAKKIPRILIFILILFNMAAFLFDIAYNKENWKEASIYAKEASDSGFKIVVFKEAMKYPFSFYYKGDFLAIKSDLNPEDLDIKSDKLLYICSHDYDKKSFLYQREIEKKLKLDHYFRSGEIEFFYYNRK